MSPDEQSDPAEFQDGPNPYQNDAYYQQKYHDPEPIQEESKEDTSNQGMSAVGALSGVGGVGKMHMFSASGVSGVSDLTGSEVVQQEFYDQFN